MSNDLLSTTEVAEQLDLARAAVYQWLAASDAGALVIRGQRVTADTSRQSPRAEVASGSNARRWIGYDNSCGSHPASHLHAAP